MMKRLLTAIAILLVAAFHLGAQNNSETLVDSVTYRSSAVMDSTLAGKSIFSMLGASGKGEVNVHQSQSIVNAMKSHIASNSSRTITGYRVRIYFDNTQNARNASESAAARFRSMYPSIAVYRYFQNPFFKVTVGDFRTKSEAIELLNRIKSEFPAAFVVKGTINYPMLANIGS